MPQILARISPDSLVRTQLTLFQTVSLQIGLTLDDQRHALELDERCWSEWRDPLSGDVVPPEPPIPEMLRRLADAAFHLSVIADRNSVSA